MNILTNSTFKSTLISLGLHACIVVLGSLAIYKTPMRSLELTGAGGRTTISLSKLSFIGKKSVVMAAPVKTLNPKLISKIAVEKTNVQTVTTSAAAVSSAASTGGSAISESGSGAGKGNGVGNGHDADQGQLFSQIKVFFENRLGSTLNINTEQLIKIKITIGHDGEILSADLVQGKLEFQLMKRVLSVAKNIPLKNYWKSASAFPQELIIPLILTPS